MVNGGRLLAGVALVALTAVLADSALAAPPTCSQIPTGPLQQALGTKPPPPSTGTGTANGQQTSSCSFGAIHITYTAGETLPKFNSLLKSEKAANKSFLQANQGKYPGFVVIGTNNTIVNGKVKTTPEVFFNGLAQNTLVTVSGGKTAAQDEKLGAAILPLVK
ncbi:MAG: hypothetical protein JO186_11425 [Actinobacteria bacterium]|nr:hypothetical protein [Actinomycetota bacterium]MBV8395089.1 hypothetical protein [Actinomycetota bacterium]